MQAMKIYILIEDKEHELRIDGNLETLCGLLYVLRNEPLTSVALTTLSVEKPDQDKERANVNY